jgi:putative ABC transport system permease protein
MREEFYLIMRYFIFILISSFDDFARNKMRTFLTSLGILIGVSSVLLLLSLGLGLKKYIEMQFESLGTNLIMIVPGGMMRGGRMNMGPGMFTGIKFDDKDVSVLKKIRSLSIVIPVNETSLEVSANGKTEYSTVISSTADIFKGLNLDIDHGGFFDKADYDKKAKTAVLGYKIADKLFGSHELSLGKYIKISDQNYHITGIIKSKGGGGLGEQGLDEHIFVPHRSSSAVGTEDKYFAVYAKSTDQKDVDSAVAETKKTLLKRYDEDEFSVMKMSEMLNTINSILGVINIVLVSIAAISLVVGGVGIMNIMYVSVAERINEIGLRRSIGATRKDILVLFLAEGIILSFAGGLFGLIISLVVITLVQSVFPAYIDLLSVCIALGVSTAIGVIFGIIPARKASQLSPIEAIRHVE